MQNRFIEWSKKKYTKKERIMAMVPLGILFVIIIPAILVMTSSLDSILNFPKFSLRPLNTIIAIALIIVGFVFAFWSNLLEFAEGEGTPAPMMPTRRLIIRGPFNYCRNPMAFGTICAYLGVVIFIGSLSSFILLIFLISMLLVYIKQIEEKELEARFGLEYLEYKKKVPFIIPKIR